MCVCIYIYAHIVFQWVFPFDWHQHQPKLSFPGSSLHSLQVQELTAELPWKSVSLNPTISIKHSSFFQIPQWVLHGSVSLKTSHSSRGWITPSPVRDRFSTAVMMRSMRHFCPLNPSDFSIALFIPTLPAPIKDLKPNLILTECQSLFLNSSDHWHFINFCPSALFC